MPVEKIQSKGRLILCAADPLKAQDWCSAVVPKSLFCEIVGVDDSYIYIKYHRAKLREDEQRLIVCHRDDSAYWYDQLRPVD